jgi:5-methylcytosine-specific restriction enzyme B
MPDHFTWIPFYEEVAQKLLGWEGRQLELVAFLNDLDSKGLPVTKVQDKDEAGQSFLLDEIDPFTFIGAFNRGTTTENRVAITQAVKTLLAVDADVPKDFDSIPLVDTRSSWFISYKRYRKPDDVPTLWRVFRAALGPDPLTDPQFEESFNAAQTIRGVKINLTMGLYWIRPDVAPGL